MYNKQVRAFFFNPVHAGDLDTDRPHTVCVKLGNRQQGQFALYAMADPSQTIIKARFKAFGNPFLVAALERLCQLMENSTIGKAQALNRADWADDLQIPQRHYPITLLVEKGLKDLCKRFAEEFEK